MQNHTNSCTLHYIVYIIVHLEDTSTNISNFCGKLYSIQFKSFHDIYIVLYQGLNCNMHCTYTYTYVQHLNKATCIQFSYAVHTYVHTLLTEVVLSICLDALLDFGDGRAYPSSLMLFVAIDSSLLLAGILF